MNMYDQIERELKILVNKEQLCQILHSYDFGKPVLQTNVYFDDDQGSVRKLGALRIRTIGEQHIFTLKIRRDSITQTELEKKIPVDSIRNIQDPEILGWLKQYGIPLTVKPFAVSQTKRYVLHLPSAELCLDETAFGAHRNYLDYEIEYEYTESHDGIEKFNRILSKIGLEYTKNAPSKLARAVSYADV